MRIPLFIRLALVTMVAFAACLTQTANASLNPCANMKEDIEPVLTLSEKDKVRFWKKVDKSGGDDACWLWTIGKSRKGYGRFTLSKKTRHAHRVAWALMNGPIIHNNSVDTYVCHRCDVPACCNPSHLFLGTHTDNMRDKMKKGRHVSICGDNHFSRSHPERLASGRSHGSQTMPEKIKRGSSHWRAKLTSAQVINIRDIRSSGERIRSIAAQFGISLSQVCAIVNRKSWTHI